jgi:hypothetical protein
MPTSFTDQQLETVRNAAAQLPPWRRSEFLRALAAALPAGEVGDGELHRLCRKVAATMARNRPGRLTSALFGRAG